MSRLFWLIIALIGGGLILLVTSGDRGTVFGLDDDAFARTLYLGVWGLVLAASIIATRMKLGDIARNVAVWLLIILVLVAGYQYRYELQDVASRITAGIVPGSPMSIEGGSAVRLDKRGDGHFGARAQVDGATVHFVVDTGASSIVLTAADAGRAGIDVAALSFRVPVSTANGVARAAATSVGTITLGPIERNGLAVLVAAPGALGQSLLGMNFLETLAGFDVRGDVMILRD
ncbi:TIGR02281 family clan AA aspartic protease [Nitratireductor alexandrii]|uniref:TIGR02281 family clan AA aspartic protease n=1 Tax=Nitratireductor alexandrii TaxID=2448161 RepID=UPI000FD9C20A|nr:TIGR02281 family clan AA aspartic protease [Nitratireductor alexandrii]